MAQPYLDQLEELTSTISPDRPGLVRKHFFSGAALYVKKRLCASLTPSGLAFKLPTERCEELISSGRALPLQYFDSSPIKQDYVLLPDFQDLSDADMSNYFKECVAHASSPDA